MYKLIILIALNIFFLQYSKCIVSTPTQSGKIFENLLSKNTYGNFEFQDIDPLIYNVLTKTFNQYLILTRSEIILDGNQDPENYSIIYFTDNTDIKSPVYIGQYQTQKPLKYLQVLEEKQLIFIIQQDGYVEIVDIQDISNPTLKKHYFLQDNLYEPIIQQGQNNAQIIIIHSENQLQYATIYELDQSFTLQKVSEKIELPLISYKNQYKNGFLAIGDLTQIVLYDMRDPQNLFIQLTLTDKLEQISNDIKNLIMVPESYTLYSLFKTKIYIFDFTPDSNGDITLTQIKKISNNYTFDQFSSLNSDNSMIVSIGYNQSTSFLKIFSLSNNNIEELLQIDTDQDIKGLKFYSNDYNNVVFLHMFNNDIFTYRNMQIEFQCQKFPFKRIQGQSVFNNNFQYSGLQFINFSPDGKTVLAVDFFSFPGGIQKIDVSNTGQPVSVDLTYILPGNFFDMQSYNSAMYTKDMQYMIYNSYDFMSGDIIVFIKLSNNSIVGQINLNDYTIYDINNEVSLLDSNDYIYVITNYQEGFLHIFNIKDIVNPQYVKKFEAKYKLLQSYFNNDQTKILFYTSGIGLLLYDITDPENLVEILEIPKTGQTNEDGEITNYEIKNAHFLKDNKHILFSDKLGSILVFNIENNTPSLIYRHIDINVPLNDENLQGISIISTNDQSLALVGYLHQTAISLYDISDINNIKYQEYFETTFPIQIIKIAPVTNIIYLVNPQQLQIVDIIQDQAIYVEKTDFQVGYINDLDIYPLRVLDTANYKCTLPLNLNYKITSIDTYAVEKDFYWQTTNLPNIYELYLDDSILRIKPETSADITQQFVSITLSNQIPNDAFVGLVYQDQDNNDVTIDFSGSKNIIYNLISTGYMDINRYLSNQYDKQSILWVDQTYTSIESDIRKIMEKYMFDLSFAIDIVGSFEIKDLQENPQAQTKLQINTPSTQQVILNLKIINDNQSSNKMYFMTSKIYPNILTTYSTDQTQILLTGQKDNINEILKQVIVTSNDTIQTEDDQNNNLSKESENQVQFNGILEVNDGINETFIQEIENLNQYLQLNNNPQVDLITLQNQFLEQVPFVQVGKELFFSPDLSQFTDPDGDNIVFNILFKAYPTNQRNLVELNQSWATLDDNWLKFNENTLQFKGIPTQQYMDTIFKVRVYANDGYKNSDYDEFQMNLFNEPPFFEESLQKQFGITEAIITENFEYQVKVKDIDHQELLYYIEEVIVNNNVEISDDRWLTIDQNTGILSGVPPIETLGYVYKIKIRVTDGLKSAEDSLEFEVQNEIFNQLQTIFEYTLIAVSIIGFIQYRDEFYNIFCKKYYKFPNDILVAGQLYRREIPLNKEPLYDSQVLYEMLQKAVKKKDKKCKNWVNYFYTKTKNNIDFNTEMFQKIVQEQYKIYLKKKLQTEEEIEIIPYEQDQIDYMIRDIQIVLGIIDYPENEKNVHAFYFDYLRNKEEQQQQQNQNINNYNSLDTISKLQSPQKNNKVQENTAQPGTNILGIIRNQIQQNQSQQIQQSQDLSKSHLNRAVSQSQGLELSHVSKKLEMILNKPKHIPLLGQNSTNNKVSHMLNDASGAVEGYSQYAPTNRKSRALKTQTKIVKNEIHQLLHSQNISNILLSYLNYQIIMDLSDNSKAEYIIKKMKKYTQSLLLYKNKSGWVQRYFEYNNQQRLVTNIFDQEFETFYNDVCNQKKKKFSKYDDNKTKSQIKSQTLLLLISEANGVAYNKSFFKNLFKKLLVPSSGLGIHSTFTNINNVACMVFDETSFIVKHCRWISAFLNQEQFTYPTPDGMPTWLSQDVDAVNNLLIIQGTPNQEDIDQEFLVRVNDNKAYILRQYVLQVVSPQIQANHDTNQDQFKIDSDSYINNNDKVKKSGFANIDEGLDNVAQRKTSQNYPNLLKEQKNNKVDIEMQKIRNNNKEQQENSPCHDKLKGIIKKKQTTVQEEDEDENYIKNVNFDNNNIEIINSNTKVGSNDEDESSNINQINNEQNNQDQHQNNNNTVQSGDIQLTNKSDQIQYDMQYMVSDIRQGLFTQQQEINGYQVNAKDMISFTEQQNSNKQSFNQQTYNQYSNIDKESERQLNVNQQNSNNKLTEEEEEGNVEYIDSNRICDVIKSNDAFQEPTYRNS